MRLPTWWITHAATEEICQIAVAEVDGEKILPDVWYDIDFVKREAVQK